MSGARWMSLALSSALFANACGASTTDVPPGPVDSATSDAVVCSEEPVRQHPAPQRVPFNEVVPLVLVEASKLDPQPEGYDLGLSQEDLDAIADRNVVLDSLKHVKKAARRSTGDDYAGMWGSGWAALTIATTGDPSVAEAALSEFPFVDIIEVDFSKIELIEWRRIVRDQIDKAGIALYHHGVDEPDNAVGVGIVEGFVLDVPEIPCAALSVVVLEDRPMERGGEPL